jgi:multidrug resistance efflux pump
MLIVATIYALLIWLIFLKLKLLPWNLPWKVIAGTIGVLMLLVVVGLLNYLTPTGRVTVIGLVAEIAPEVSGTVKAVHVEANVPVEAGALLFEIDPETYQYDVDRLKASLVDAQSEADRIKVTVAEYKDDLEALKAKLELAKLDEQDLKTLVKKKVAAQNKLDKATLTVKSVTSQAEAMSAKVRKAEIEAAATVGGTHVRVIEARQQLNQAEWRLRKTRVVAPSRGYVTGLTLTPGNQATPTKPVMTFIDASTIIFIGIFPQNGFAKIGPGTKVKMILNNLPGRILETEVIDVIRGTSDGQLAPAGTLPDMASIGNGDEYAVRIKSPAALRAEDIRVGMAGYATIFTDGAGAIGILAQVLLWISALTSYL